MDENTEIARLRSELERLRGTLRRIEEGNSDSHCDCEHDTPECCVKHDYFCPHCIAGAALKEKS